MLVTYLSHSGFLAETEHRYMLFDYYKGTVPPMKPEKPLYVFVSHAHQDHYNKAIFGLGRKGQEVTYLLSDDIEKSGVKTKARCIYFGAGEKKEVDGMEIETFLSTDQGVAFLVRADGKAIFHAGDLHWWHWMGEPDSDNEAMEQAYLAQMGQLENRHFDVAFLVLDPRQEEAFDWGFDYFMKHTDTDIAFPMHFWGKYSVIDDYKYSEKAKGFRKKIMEICREGQEFELKV